MWYRHIFMISMYSYSIFYFFRYGIRNSNLLALKYLTKIVLCLVFDDREGI